MSDTCGRCNHASMADCHLMAIIDVGEPADLVPHPKIIDFGGIPDTPCTRGECRPGLEPMIGRRAS